LRDSIQILSTRVRPIRVDEAARLVCRWASEHGARAVCAANVHMLMEAHYDPGFAGTLAAADLVVCDGRPLVWAARLQGFSDAHQCRGLDLMMAVCELASSNGLSIGLYGAEPAVSDEVRRRLMARYPGLDVTYCWSPPFRELSRSEDAAAIEDLLDAAPDILFVSLGCPKQERWMLAHRDRISCVMLGVGAAFDMMAGRIAVAPRWMQRAGLEWVFRLRCEPARLWRRYARYNSAFTALLILQWCQAIVRGVSRSDD
jgi:N-acetylglucosaminyldiphosphoundecaprenol N-acetyl-beta-D-mannosaminyltransferase